MVGKWRCWHSQVVQRHRPVMYLRQRRRSYALLSNRELAGIGTFQLLRLRVSKLGACNLGPRRSSLRGFCRNQLGCGFGCNFGPHPCRRAVVLGPRPVRGAVWAALLGQQIPGLISPRYSDGHVFELHERSSGFTIEGASTTSRTTSRCPIESRPTHISRRQLRKPIMAALGHLRSRGIDTSRGLDGAVSRRASSSRRWSASAPQGYARIFLQQERPGNQA